MGNFLLLDNTLKKIVCLVSKNHFALSNTPFSTDNVFTLIGTEEYVKNERNVILSQVGETALPVRIE